VNNSCEVLRICLKIDILLSCSTQKQMESEKVIWVLLVAGVWLTFGAYATWFFFKAETFQPLALEDLVLAYKLHKRQAKCPTQRIQTLFVRDGWLVGFQCECGYKYVQKRLVSQRILKGNNSSTIHSIHHRLSNLFETKNRLREMGLECHKIKKI
jgi:hypothetical protein